MLKLSTREAQATVDRLPEASSSQLRRALNQRVSPTIDQRRDEEISKNLELELASTNDQASAAETQILNMEQMGDMPRPRSPMHAVLANSGIWLFLGFTLMT